MLAGTAATREGAATVEGKLDLTSVAHARPRLGRLASELHRHGEGGPTTR
jgi:hypothetical protein